MLESSQNHSPPLSLWKNCLPLNQPLVPKRLGTTEKMVTKGNPGHIKGGGS